jgi:hypothetical protein
MVEHRHDCRQDAGEVGDGPDQGHSGGADSVPPAPKLSTLTCVVAGASTLSSRKKPQSACLRERNVRKAGRYLSYRENLRLRGLRHPGSHEHGAETSDPSCQQIDRVGSTLRYLLTFVPRLRIASQILVRDRAPTVMQLPPLSERRRSQATHHHCRE